MNAQGPDPAPDPRRWRILAVTMGVGFLALLDVSIVNIALPSIRTAMEASNATVQWVISGYALTFGLVLVTGGRLGDALGRRRMMMIGIVGFVLSSAACGFAPNLTLLIVARLVQGAFAGLLLPQNTGMIQAFFQGAERAKAFGYMGMTVGVSSSIGPVLGGLIIAAAGDETGWRWVFLVNVPVGVVLLVAIWKLVPSRDPGAGRADLDLLGAVLIGLTVLFVIYPVTTLETGLTWQLALLVGAPLFGALAVWWEKRCTRVGRTPMLDIDLLAKTRGYASGLAVGSVYFMGFGGVLLTYSVFVQDGLDASALEAGLLVLPFAVASAIASPLSARLVARLGRRTTLLALGTMAGGMIATAILVPPLEGTVYLIPVMLVTMFITGFGGGSVVSPNLTLTLQHVPPAMGGSAGAALQTGQRMGQGIGAALMLVIYQLGQAQSGDPGEGLRAVLIAASVIIGVAGAIAFRDLVVTSRQKASRAS